MALFSSIPIAVLQSKWYRVGQVGGTYMMERRIYHVTRKGNDSWQVIKEGFKRPHIVRHTKAEAVLVAKRLAKSNPEAQVIVHSEDNLVESEYRYTPTAA